MKIRRSVRDRRRTFVLVEALEPRRLLAADLVISEFMANNSTTLADQAGNYPDWIEIHNAGDATANLNDYFLTDKANDPEEWQFPVQNLAAGGYLVVFADSTTTAPVANTELHTNFSLSAAGEYLALINAADDSVQFAYSPTFPPQEQDVSYGLSNADDPNSTQVYFSTPTPGAANVPTTAEPTFSTAGKTFSSTSSISLTLSDATTGAKIYYTTDDSTPTTSSTLYSGPISITKSEAIRTFAVASNLAASPVTSQTYEAVDSTVTSVQNQNLPVIIINTYGGTINETSDIAGSATIMNTTNGTTNILGTADYQGRIGIHIRGSTSESYPKQQYSLDLWDDNDNGRNASLLGMPSDSSWVLYAPYTELSLMQNPLSYELANEMGDYASRTQYVEVYMSTAGNSYVSNTSTINYTSNYLGIFVLEEKVKASDTRVDVGDEISATNPNGGYIVEQDRYTGNDYFTTPQGVHLDYSDPDPDPTISSSNTEGNIQTSWDAFENALFTGSAGAGQPWDTPGNADYYGNYINIASFVNYYLLEEMTRNVDAFWLSTYYNKQADTIVNGVDTQRGLISAGPVWDFNLSLGATNYNLEADAEGWDTDELTPYPGAAGVTGFNPQDPYFQRLLTDPNFDQAVDDRWEQLRQGVLSTANLTADIQSYVNLLSDNTGVYPVGTSPTGTTSPVMRNFQKWPELGVYVTTDSDYDPSGSWITDVGIMENWLTARVNWMDSQFMPQATITPGGSFASPVSVTMSPVDAATTTDTQLIGPDSTIFYKVPTANIANWQTLSIVNGSGVLTAPSGWSTGTTGLGYDTTTTPVNFNPYINTNLQSAMQNKEADVFTLMNFNISNPASVQALILKIQYDDGFTAWVNGVRVMDANTPENINPVYNTDAASAGNDSLAITYREFDITAVKGLLKAGNNTLAIQGMNIKASDGDFLLAPTLYTRTYSYPTTTGQVYYTTNGTDPRTNTGAISSSAILYSSALMISSSTQIQARTYINGVWGALTSEVYDFTTSSLRITELMYDPPPVPGFSSQDAEYVELQNVSSSPLNLLGYQFNNGVNFVFPNTTLAPGAYAVVVKNAAAFAARYGTSIDVLGNYGSSNFDNSGETVTLIDGFGETVESFKYSSSWYPSTAGQGYSLVVVNPTGSTSTLGTAAGWRASYAPLGAPGQEDSDSVTPAVTSWTVAENGAGNQPTITMTFDSTVSAGSPANLSVVNTVTGVPLSPVTAAFNGSSIVFSLPASTPSGDYAVTLPAAQVFNVSDTTAQADMTQNVLLVRASDTYAVPSTGLTVQQLVLGTDGKLDVGTSSVTIDNPTVSTSTIEQLIESGYDSGNWDGPGIMTSDGGLNSPIAVGFANGTDGVVANLPSGEILIKGTYYGDADLSGQPDINDLNIVLSNYLSGTPTTWDSGDFNYDGTTDINDLNAVLTNYLDPVLPAIQVAAPSAATAAATPSAASPSATTPAATPPAASAAPTVAVSSPPAVTTTPLPVSSAPSHSSATFVNAPAAAASIAATTPAPSAASPAVTPPAASIAPTAAVSSPPAVATTPLSTSSTASHSSAVVKPPSASAPVAPVVPAVPSHTETNQAVPTSTAIVSKAIPAVISPTKAVQEVTTVTTTTTTPHHYRLSPLRRIARLRRAQQDKK